MPTVKTHRTEHYKIADYSYVEITAEVEDEYPDIKTGLTENHKSLKSYMNAARRELKEAFAEGHFDLTD